MKTTAERLKTIMEERGLRQADILALCKPFCEKYGVKLSKSDLSQYLSGKSKPKQDKLTMLGMALNLDETWLMGFDVERTKYESNKSVNESPVYIGENNNTLMSRFYTEFGEMILTDDEIQEVINYTKYIISKRSK